MSKRLTRFPLQTFTADLPIANPLVVKSKRRVKQTTLLADNLNFKYNAIFNSNSCHFIILDKQLKVIDFNDGLSSLIKKLFNTDVKTGIYIGNFLITSFADELLANCARALAGETFTVQRELIDSEGKLSWWQGDYSPAYNSFGQIAGMIFHAVDVTEHKRHELKVEQQNRRLKEISLLQSHDIRGPVCTLAGLMNLIQMEGTDKLIDYLPFIATTIAELDKKVCAIVDLANEE